MRLSPGLHAATLAGWTLALCVGCVSRDDTQAVVRVPCGGGDLEIVEVVDRGGLTSGAADFQLQLRYRSAPERPFRPVDRAPKRTPIYSKLYSPAAQYVALVDESNVPWTAADRERYVWDVFVSPHEFSREEYERIATCLRAERDAIQRALAVPRAPYDRFDIAPERSPALASVVNLDYDYAYRPCEPHSLSRTFACPGGEIFLQVNPPDIVQMCAPAPEQDLWLASTVGRLDRGQEVLRMRSPLDLRLAIAAGQPRDWLKFYARCEDGTGATIAGYFQLQPWVADGRTGGDSSIPVLPLQRLMQGARAAPVTVATPPPSGASTTVD